MITGTYEELAPLVGRNVCPECEKPIEVAWDSQANTYYIRCGNSHRPDSLKRILSASQEAEAEARKRSGAGAAGSPKSSQKTPVKYQAPEAVTMGGIKAVDLGTGELLAPAAVQMLIDYAGKYDLDPVRGHVVMLYGKPYIGLDGYLYHANRSGIPYSLNSRPLNCQEREEIQVVEGDHAWRAEITKLETNELAIGIGIVTKAEREEESTKRPGQLRSPVVARHPWQLAQKRAEWQALRRAFPIGGD